MKTTDYLLNQNGRTSMRAFPATKMKCAVSALISLAFVSQTFALLRPLFPAKPMPPLNGELVVIGNDLAVEPASKHLLKNRNHVR